MTGDRLDEVVRRSSGFNEVGVTRTPNGELVVSLTHRSTSDDEVLLRIRGEDDVILTDEVLDRNPDAWEDDSETLGRINHGGNWG